MFYVTPTSKKHNPRKRAAAGSLVLLLLLTLLLGGQPSSSGSLAYAASPVVMLYGSAPDAPDSELQAIVEDVVKDLPGDWGVAVKKLDTGQYAVYNGDKQQVSASLYKMWVLAELFRQTDAGIISLDDQVTVTGSDAYEDAQLNELRISEGYGITLRHAAELMVQLSDNTAAHLLVRTLGPDNINRFMQENGLYNSVLDWDGAGDNLTTPLDVLREMEMIATSQMVSADASRQMVDLMLGQGINNLLPPGLPDGTPFAHKTGALGNLLHDGGIVYSPAGPYVIVVMSQNLDDYGTAWTNMPELSRRVYRYFTARASSPARYFPETRQSVGHDFLKFWQSFGGLQTFGYPISPEQVQNNLLVQQFERGRFELHPDGQNNGGYQPQLVLGTVGSERAAQLGLTWANTPRNNVGQYFEQTGQNLSGEFLDYWLSHGGERIFGLPISPAASMVSPTDGKPYMTQWFQRARMEIHPELPPGSRVALGNLGSELAQQK